MTETSKVSDEEYAAALELVLGEHARWFRDNDEGHRLVLLGALLHEADFPEANLTGADLRDADLTAAKLAGAYRRTPIGEI
jgi:uncharacterized protein YjbI with pentapeptide repeats